MRVLVMGAGLVGVTTAWYLAKAGHQVEVIDRRQDAGMETSRLGGLFAAAHAGFRIDPLVPVRSWRWSADGDAPVAVRWRRWDPALWAWSLRFLANQTPARRRRHAARFARLVDYARACLIALRQETGLALGQEGRDVLYIHRDPRGFEFHRQMIAALPGHALKTPAEAVAIEPALASVAGDLAGAILLPGSESGDPSRFTRELAALCTGLGVEFRYGTALLGLEMEGERLRSVATDQGRLHADSFVMALGAWSTRFTSQLDVHLPLYPVKGYAVTVRIADDGRAPHIDIVDHDRRLTYHRQGDMLRCVGTVELTGWDDAIRRGRARAIVRQAQALFPGGADFETAETLTGLCPTSPDSLPVLGRGRVPNLLLNTGHGMLGWTMCCGTAKLVTDLLSGRPGDIDTDGLTPERFARR